MTPNLTHIYAGKVREMYDAGEGRLFIVASDRLSAFDVVMDEPVPDKGRVLTAISSFWFDKLGHIAPNHLISTDVADFPEGAKDPELAGRSMLVKRAEMLPIECVVRGYLAGSGWKEYSESGTLHGTTLSEGLQKSSRLTEPLFTPATKAEDGEHDENISYEQAVDMVGPEVAAQARDISLELYTAARDYAAERGIIIADTKFELGFVDGELVIADEILTPDSSRFWPADQWRPGETPPSYDKQPVRDYLDGLDWDKTPPAPPLPDDVIESARSRYVEGYELLTGLSFESWKQIGSKA